MFDMDAAKSVAMEAHMAAERHGKPPLAEVGTKPKNDAREAAVAARTASRLLQSLTSKVWTLKKQQRSQNFWLKEHAPELGLELHRKGY